MNNLAYTSQNAETIGAKLEEKVREETGSGGPLAYTVETGEDGAATVGSFFRDIGSALVGGADAVLFRFHFELPAPRPAHLMITMNRQGVGSHAGLIVYSAPLSKPVGGEVSLEEPKFWSKSNFTGDADASSKLNANGDLIKRVNSFARTESQSGGLTLKIKRACRVVPHENGSMLIIGTLPRPTKMGFGATIDAKEFFDIAQMVEAAL